MILKINDPQYKTLIEIDKFNENVLTLQDLKKKYDTQVMVHDKNIEVNDKIQKQFERVIDIIMIFQVFAT